MTAKVTSRRNSKVDAKGEEKEWTKLPKVDEKAKRATKAAGLPEELDVRALFLTISQKWLS